jgi:DNA anti-recombination protein RmuC
MNNPITQADIAETLNKISDRFEELKQDISGINTTVQSIDKRLTNVESSVQKILDLNYLSYFAHLSYSLK